MGLLLSRLENVDVRADGTLTAGCPACMAEGRDHSKDHLYCQAGPDGKPGGGKFGCVVKDCPDHRSLIAQIAGDGDYSRPKKVKEPPKRGFRPAWEIRQRQERGNRVSTKQSVLGQNGQKSSTSGEELNTNNTLLGQLGYISSTYAYRKRNKDNKDSLYKKPDAIRPSYPDAENALKNAIEDLGGCEQIALDVETWGRDPGDALKPWAGEIRLLTLKGRDGDAHVIDLLALGRYDLGALKPILEKANVIAHNAVFDAHFLRSKCDLNLRNITCTMTASRLLNNSKVRKRGTNSLDACLQRHLNVEPGEELGASDWSGTLSERQLAYARRDVEHLHDLWDALAECILQDGLERVWEVEKALIPVVVDMQAHGMLVSISELHRARETCQEEKLRLEDDLMKEIKPPETDQGFLFDAKPRINLDSPDQLLKALRMVPGLEDLTSTDREDLVRHEDLDVIERLLRYKRIKKELEALEDYAAKVTGIGRLHASFNPGGTSTGRFTSSRPNLQQVPRGAVRNLFIAGRGRKIIACDYGQVELRIASAIAGETRMIDAYKNGVDLHRRTAAIILGKKEEDVNAEDRQIAKSANFGLLYGSGANGLKRYAEKTFGLEMTLRRAEDIRAKFFASYSHLAQWHKRAREQAKDPEVTAVRTIMGRRQWLPELTEETVWPRFTALVNTEVQGCGADALKMALVRLSEELPAGCHILSTIHDEILLEVPEAKANEVASMVSRVMVNAIEELIEGVPFEAEPGIGDNWGEAK